MDQLNSVHSVLYRRYNEKKIFVKSCIKYSCASLVSWSTLNFSLKIPTKFTSLGNAIFLVLFGSYILSWSGKYGNQ